MGVKHQDTGPAAYLGTEKQVATGNALLDVVGQMLSSELDSTTPEPEPADATVKVAKAKASKPVKTPRSDKGDEKPKRGLTPGFCLHCGKTMDTEWRFERTRCNACGLYKMRHGGMDKPPHLMNGPTSSVAKLANRLAALSAMAKSTCASERSVITTLKGHTGQQQLPKPNAGAAAAAGGGGPHSASASTAATPSRPAGPNGGQLSPHMAGGQRQITTQPVGSSVAAILHAATTSNSQGAPGNNHGNKTQLLGNKAAVPANTSLSGRTRKLSELAAGSDGINYAGSGLAANKLHTTNGGSDPGDSSSSGVSTQVPSGAAVAAAGGGVGVLMPAGSQSAPAGPPSKRARSDAASGAHAAAAAVAANSSSGVATSVPLHLVNCCNAAAQSAAASVPSVPASSAGQVQAVMPAAGMNAGRVVHVVQQQPMGVSGAFHPAPVQYMMVGDGLQPVHMVQGQAVHAVQQQQQPVAPAMVQHMVMQAPVHNGAAQAGSVMQAPGRVMYRMLGPAGGCHYVQQAPPQQQQQFMMVLGPPDSGNMLQPGTAVMHHHPQQQGAVMRLQQQQQYGAPHSVMMMGPAAVTMALPQMMQQEMVMVTKHQVVQQQQQQPVYVMQGLC